MNYKEIARIAEEFAMQPQGNLSDYTHKLRKCVYSAIADVFDVAAKRSQSNDEVTK